MMNANPFLELRRPVILASSSPRRAALLRETGIAFTVMEPAASEHQDPAEGPVEHAVQVALRKARGIAARIDDGLVLAADTIVVVDGRVLGKPASAEEARRMLGLLGGRGHEVITGVALIERPGDAVLADAARTLVTMRRMSDHEIEGYVASGEPMDKAGGYGIQGAIAAVVERIDGCYFNVVGLPLALLAAMLRRFPAG